AIDPMSVRTRFAPSPTGRLHLGNVRAAAFNWLFSKSSGGVFILRIEDTDIERNVDEGEASILEDLRWLGLDWDEGPDVDGAHGPYRQSGRSELYASKVDGLMESGGAYTCFFTEVEGQEDSNSKEVTHQYSGVCRGLDPDERNARLNAEEPHVIRFSVPQNHPEVTIQDEVFGSISFPINDIDDFVICRTDGRVTYNFGVVVDDIDMEITHVIRGVGHLSNTPKQVLLFDALGANRPVFAHLPTVLGPDGRKLSKREGATSIQEMKAQGYPADAVLNYVSLLGWSHPEEKEILSNEELAASMSLDRVGRSDCQLDPDKFRWVSQQHLARQNLQELVSHVRPFIDTDRFPDTGDNLSAVIDTLRTRLSTYKDINDHLGLLFPEDKVRAELLRKEVGADPEVNRTLIAVREKLQALERWEEEGIGTAIREAGTSAGVKGAELFHPVRRVLIGSEKGPDLGKILVGLGMGEGIRRIDQAIGE
ncbi:MAG: glutamate--tRNA ligase, partial [Gemmatimonadota bacterium]|nr:glutamate--tRNA ligase [Gemmatimonadota bacterium]MEC9318018.1 glutamate--tRNA ligase [Gemmatimonadota bacterium]